MAAKYRAHYEGTCSRCMAKISVGDYIAWARTKGPKKIYHVDCKNPSIWPFPEEAPEEQSPKQEQPPRIIEGKAFDNNHICKLCDKTYGKHSSMNFSCPIDGMGLYHNSDRFTPIETPDFGIDGDEMHRMEEPPPDDNQAPITTYVKPSSSSSDALLDLISSKVEEKVLIDVQRKVDGAVGKIDKIVKDKLDTLSIPSIIVKRHELPEVKLHNVHKQFKDVLELVNAGEYVYLHGAPGGHKSTIGPQLAEALGVRYGYMSLSEQTPEYVVKGFTSPIDGKYYGSMFADFYENGGLFCWEELDAANDNLRASLNTMLENKIAALDKGLVNRHEKFYLVANGNTCGRGAHPAFPSRTSFDAAFASRFIYLQFEYDWKLAKHIALGLNPQSGPIATWAEKVSNWALANGIQLVMSPREVYKLAKLTKITSLSNEILLDGVLRGLDIPSKDKLLQSYPFPSISRD